MKNIVKSHSLKAVEFENNIFQSFIPGLKSLPGILIILIKTIIYAGFFISTSYMYPMTLEELPQDAKELIAQNVIKLSNSAQQADRTIANLSCASHSWHAVLLPYTSQQQNYNYMTEALKIKCTNTITTIINDIMLLTEEEYRAIFDRTKLSGDELTAINTYIISQMPKFDIQFKNIFDLLTANYINTPEAQISCFYDLLKLYKLNRQYPVDPTIIPQTTVQTNATLKSELKTISESLLIQYAQTRDPIKRYRIGHIITFLHNRTLFTCPPINLHMQSNLIPQNSISDHLCNFLRIHYSIEIHGDCPQSYCTQEDVTFLNRTINLKKHLRYSPIQSTKAALKNREDIPESFAIAIITSAFIIKTILISTTLISLQKIIGTKKMLYASSAIGKSVIKHALVLIALGSIESFFETRNLQNIQLKSHEIMRLEFKAVKSLMHSSYLPILQKIFFLISISGIAHNIVIAPPFYITIMHSLGRNGIITMAKASPLILATTIALFLYSNRQHEGAVVIKRELQKRNITI